MRFFCFLVLILFTTSAFAKTTIFRSGPYLYFKTPYKEWQEEERAEVLQRAAQIVVQKLATAKNKINPDEPVTEETLLKLEILSLEMDEYLKKLELYTDRHAMPGLSVWSGAPTAFFFFLGGKFDVDVKLGGGVAGGLGIMIMPMKVTRLDLLTRKVASYYRFDSSWVVFANGQLGAGLGVAPAARLGMGLVWGEADSVEEIVGPTLGGSTTVIAGKGINVKLGALKQWKRTRVNPFASAALELGPAAAVNWHANLGAILPASEIMDGLFGNFQGVEIAGPGNDTTIPPGMIEKELQELERQHPEGTPVTPSAIPSSTPSPEPTPQRLPGIKR